MEKLEIIKFFDENECASICDYVPLFYAFKHISNGKPQDTCTNVIQDKWFKERGLDKGAVSFMGCMILSVISILA